MSAELLKRTGRVHSLGLQRERAIDPADPYDDQKPWGKPDPWQCEYDDGEGHRCVLGKTHIGGHLPKTCEEA